MKELGLNNIFDMYILPNIKRQFSTGFQLKWPLIFGQFGNLEWVVWGFLAFHDEVAGEVFLECSRCPLFCVKNVLGFQICPSLPVMPL